jgi:hypothetical protein
MQATATLLKGLGKALRVNIGKFLWGTIFKQGICITDYRAFKWAITLEGYTRYLNPETYNKEGFVVIKRLLSVKIFVSSFWGFF